MSAFEAAVLGAVQGLTEFIPISSSGHLVVVPEALGWSKPGLAFDVLLHTASLLALVVYFAKDLMGIISGTLRGSGTARRTALLLAVGTVPAAGAGILLGEFFEESFEDASAAAVQLVITAVILVAAELVFSHHSARRASQERPLRRIENLNAADATIIGGAQAISILPGISRSGATIGAGLALAMDRSDSARFAFLLAIPALLGASLVEIPELSGTTLSMQAAAAGFVTSLITSYAAIWGLIRYLKTRTLYPFAVYCVVAGIFFYAVV
ncbi:MAG: undecaprenyl-diphosphate phosphatase [Actinomycetota bacterium]|nr:undecaprenyl-diphosphate phosphatase [Actinomycetota bacterium]